MANSSSQLDTRIEIVTPENIAFHYHLAGPFRRLMAYLLDWLIRAAVIFFLAVGVAMFGVVGLGGMGVATILIAIFVLDWFYGGLFEAFMNGQTPGKRMLRLRVVTDRGQPISGWQAILRNFMRGADALPAFLLPLGFMSLPLVSWQLGFIVMMLNNRSQRLGDLITGTMVVMEEPAELYGVQRVTEPEAIRLAADLPPNFEASKELARALSAYVSRRQMFGPARRLEIARHMAEPLRIKLDLPGNVSYDVLLCALYHRVFIADKVADADYSRPSPRSPAAQAPPIVGQPYGQPWAAAQSGQYSTNHPRPVFTSDERRS
ncbi:MAG: RDD family protein [Pirellulales bacterium]